MGFSIGRFIGGIAPLIGIASGSVGGAILGAGIGAAFEEPQRPVGRQTTPTVPQPPAAFVQSTSVVPSATRTSPFSLSSATSLAPLLRGVGAGALLDEGARFLFGNGNGNGSQISDILKRARQTFGPGVTKNKIIAAAKACGIDLAAQTFGISSRDICTIIVAGRSRRRRGVSAADIRRTKRTLKFVAGVRKDLRKIKV